MRGGKELGVGRGGPQPSPHSKFGDVLCPFEPLRSLKTGDKDARPSYLMDKD